MFTDKKKSRAFVVMAALLLAIIVNGIFTLGSVRNAPVSAWQSEPGAAGSTYFSSYVTLEVKATNENGDSLKTVDAEGKTLVHAWIHVGRISASNTKDGYGVLTFQWNSTGNFDSSLTSNKFTAEIRKGVDSSSDQHQYGWYDVPMNKFYRYCKISTNDVLELNEVVFTNDEGELLSATVHAASVWSDDDRLEDVDAADLPEGSAAYKIIDEQKLFKEYSSMTKKYNFTSDEAETVNAALTVFGGNGEFVSKKAGPFGVELIAVGLSVFGINTLGVRIIPYLFFMLTVALLFAVGRRIFNDTDAGILFSVFYVLFGIGLSVGSVGNVNSIAVFFAVLAVYFMQLFAGGVKEYYYTADKRSFRAGKTALLVPVLLSAFAFGVAVNVSLASYFVLPAVAVLFAGGLIKTVKVRKYNASVSEYDDEKIRNDKQFRINFVGSIVAAVLSYVLFTFILTILFYGILGTTYTSYYGTDSLLAAINLNNKGALFGRDGSAGTFLKWIAGGGSALIYSGANNGSSFGEVYVGMNVAVQFISLTSLFFATVAVVIGKCYKGASAELKLAAKTYFPQYILFAVGWLCSWILYAFVKGCAVYDYLLSSVFATGLIILCSKMLSVWNQKLFTVKGKAVTLSAAFTVCALALSAVFFALGYVMFAGIEVSSVAAKILFRWWLW
ncbi:MAG: hypothetical protein IJR61_05120 [Clostridia bacterium]|nr:hypothetical protein [Clostridia bacterium]